MGIAALVLGIISILLIPFCGFFTYLPAIIGLILGIIDIVLKKKNGEKKGIAIAGTILSTISVVLITTWILLTIVFGVIATASDQGTISKSKKAADNYKNAAKNEQLTNVNSIINQITSTPTKH